MVSKQQRLCLNLVDDRIDLCWETSSLVSDQHMNTCPTGFHVSKTVQVRTSVYQDSQNPGGTELSPYSKQEVLGRECYRWFLIFISFWGLQRLCSTKLGKLVLLQTSEHALIDGAQWVLGCTFSPCRSLNHRQLWTLVESLLLF